MTVRSRARLFGLDVISEFPLAGVDGPLGDGPATRPTRLPLAALAFLDRGGPAGALEVERIEQPDPRLLLSSTFNFAIRTPERLVRLLDACGALARSVPILRVRSGADVAPALVVALDEAIA